MPRPRKPKPPPDMNLGRAIQNNYQGLKKVQAQGMLKGVGVRKEFIENKHVATLGSMLRSIVKCDAMRGIKHM